MANLAEATKTATPRRIKQAAIVNEGEKIILPARMGYDEAITQIQRMRDYENQEIVIQEEVNAFVLDGAAALNEAMKRIYGWVNAVPTPGFFGPQPPAMIQIETGYKESILVPWGSFKLPGVQGTVQTNSRSKNGRNILVVAAKVLRKHEAEIKKLVELTRTIAEHESIYKGKAFRLRFKEDADSDSGEAMKPVFLDLSGVRPEELIFSAEVDSAVRTSVFTPIEHTASVRKAGIPLKRGILLSGRYGVGKTLVAYVTAKKAAENGWTFVYCEKADELKEALRFAQAYAPAVIFCEDIDRVTSGERSVSMDDILNTIDGLDSKHSELMVILTTNNVEAIHKAMLRPGRLDAVINVLPPDAAAVERLIRLYGRGLVDENADLSVVGAALAGQIPAVIRECVERAKLAAIRLNEGYVSSVSQEALEDAALGMQNQLKLLSDDKPGKPAEVVALETLAGFFSAMNKEDIKEAAAAGVKAFLSSR